jgi:hypothetical protein
MDEYIANPTKLKFDPNGNNISKDLKLIFQNKLARTLWIGIKQRHLTSQYFEGHCLNASKALEKDGVPDSAEKLEHLIGRHFGIGYSKEFIEELLPYLSGKKNLEYEVVK